MKAMCAIAFFAALRIGVITIASGKSPQNLIQFNQVIFLRNASGSYAGIKLTLRFFKHSNPAQPDILFIHTNKPICPISILVKYQELRGAAASPLFCWPDNLLFTRKIFTGLLNAALTFCGLDVFSYKSHSFRIEAAPYAAGKGLSDAQIREFGR